MDFSEWTLVCYCAKNCCLDCEKTKQCAEFYKDHGKLPYLFYRPYKPITNRDFRKVMKINETR